MTLSINEDIESRPWEVGKKATLVFNLFETSASDYPTSDAALQVLVASTAPTTFEGLRRKDAFRIRRHGRSEATRVRVDFEKIEDENELKLTLDFGAGSQTVKQSLGTTAYASDIRQILHPGLPPTDHHGLIGVESDAVQGVEVPIATFDFTITRFVKNENINGFIQDLLAARARVNDDAVSFTIQSWQPTFDPGELLFRGATATPRVESEDWEIPLRFSAESNVDDLQMVGFAAQAIPKDGWDYVWVRHVDSEDEDAKTLTRLPEGAYREEVIRRAPLSGLFF